MRGRVCPLPKLQRRGAIIRTTRRRESATAENEGPEFPLASAAELQSPSLSHSLAPSRSLVCLPAALRPPSFVVASTTPVPWPNIIQPPLQTASCPPRSPPTRTPSSSDSDSAWWSCAPEARSSSTSSTAMASASRTTCSMASWRSACSTVRTYGAVLTHPPARAKCVTDTGNVAQRRPSGSTPSTPRTRSTSSTTSGSSNRQFRARGHSLSPRFCRSWVPRRTLPVAASGCQWLPLGSFVRRARVQALLGPSGLLQGRDRPARSCGSRERACRATRTGLLDGGLPPVDPLGIRVLAARLGDWRGARPRVPLDQLPRAHVDR